MMFEGAHPSSYNPNFQRYSVRESAAQQWTRALNKVCMSTQGQLITEPEHLRFGKTFEAFASKEYNDICTHVVYL